MCKNGMWRKATEWMGDEPRAVNPHHVAFVRNPLMDDRESRLVADKAYRLSAIETRGPELGAIDVVSRGQGVVDAQVSSPDRELGNADGHVSPINPHVCEYRHLDEPVPADTANVLDVRSAGVGEVTVDPGRAGVDCAADLDVATDGPLRIILTGCGRTETFDGTDSGDLAKPETYGPADPLEPLGNPVQGAPLPAEVGNAPQLPLQQLPPLRFPPSHLGLGPSPGDGS
jgi:hypothetical protein